MGRDNLGNKHYMVSESYVQEVLNKYSDAKGKLTEKKLELAAKELKVPVDKLMEMNIPVAKQRRGSTR